MPLVTEQRLRTLAQTRSSRAYKSSRTILQEAITAAQYSFDVFLSHSIRDADLVLGAKEYLETWGLSVYVDWIIDSDLDRDKVSPATAAILRQRMRQCTSLVYLHSLYSSTSKWMPWELGYFDGMKPGRVAILPIARTPQNGFAGQEYLGLYPYIDEVPPTGETASIPWVNETIDTYARFKEWAKGTAQIRKH